MARTRRRAGGSAPPAPRNGLPSDLQLYSPFPFKGLQSKSSVVGIDDAAFVWIENWVRHGDGQLITVPSNGAALYTAPGGLTIHNFASYQRAGILYWAVFLSDGSAVEVRVSNGATTTIGAAATFTTSPSAPPAATGWAGLYLLIGSSDAYHIWDGTHLFGPGTLSPDVTLTGSGIGYASAPAVAISGGSGAGATAVATLGAGGVVVKLTITNPGSGYLPNDGPLLKAVFTGGGITNKVAQGTAAIGNGGVVSITITDGGTGYTNQATVTIAAPGAGTTATAVAAGTANSITQAIIVTPGQGYAQTPAVTFSAPAGGGHTATGVAIIGVNGITSITVTDGGSGYTGTPTVVITDSFGFGTGATAVAHMNAGVVSSVDVLNPGQNYQQAVVTFVGGNPAVAAATINLMPQGGIQPVSGSDVAVFKNRVAMVRGTYRYLSAPGTVANFSAAAGGVISQNTDNNLILNLTGLVTSSGFLFEFGDSEINAISNPQTSTSSGATSTIFTITNVDPLIGCLWPRTIQPFSSPSGSAIVFATPMGVYALYGSSVRKISGDIDDLFTSLPAQTPPSASVTLIGDILYYALSILATEPATGANRQVILLWDGREWFVSSQDVTITAISPLATGGNYTAYGTDGTKLYPCFTTPSGTLAKTIISKFYGVESAIQWKQALRFYVSFEQSTTFSVVLHTELGDLNLGTISYPGAAGPSSPNGYNTKLTVLGQDAQGVNGRYLGWTLTTTSASNALDYMALAYRLWSGYYS